MPLLIAIIHNFRCSNSEEPQAGGEMLVLGVAQKQSRPFLLLKGSANQNITCEKENQHPQGQGKVAAVTIHTPVVSSEGGKGLLKPKNETFEDRSEGESCVPAQESPCPHRAQSIC